MATFTDDFNRADSTALGANWVEDSGQWQISTNTLIQSTVVGAYYKCRWATAPDGNTQYAQVAGRSDSTLVAYGAFVRGAASGTVTYYAQCVFGGDADYLVEITAGAETILDTGSARGTGVLTVRIEASGSSLTGSIGGVASTSATDASLTSGSVGVMAFGDLSPTASRNIDDFTGGDIATAAAPETVRGLAVMPVLRRAFAASLALPSLWTTAHRGPLVQQTTVTAPRVVLPRSQRTQPLAPRIVHSAAVVAVPLVATPAPRMPARPARLQPAPARLVYAAAVPAVPLVPALVHVPTRRFVRAQPEAPRLVDVAAVPAVPLIAVLRPVMPAVDVSWQVIQPPQLHATAAPPFVPRSPLITPTTTARPQVSPWKALESPAVAAPQSTVTQGDVRPRFEAPGWQVSQSGQYHTPGAAAPQSFVTLGTVLPMAEAAGWQVIQASQLHETTAVFVPPAWASSSLPRPRSQPGVASPLDTFVTIAPQSTVTAGTVTPAWVTARRFAGTAALFEQAAVVAPYVPELATRLSDATTRRSQPALWRPVDVAAAILDTMLPQSPWAMPVVRWTPRAQPLVWQAINGVPIPPTPGLPGHATTGHAGLAGTRNIATGRPVWGRW